MNTDIWCSRDTGGSTFLPSFDIEVGGYEMPAGLEGASWERGRSVFLTGRLEGR